MRLAVALALALAVLALGAAPAGAADVTLRKAMWGPVERAGQSQFPIYAELGVGLYQTTMRWDVVAPARPAAPRDPLDPAYAWPAEIDAAIAEGEKYGIEVSILVLGAPGWANGGRDWRWAPSDPGLFADFMEAASRRFPKVRHWMIWGEPTKELNYQPLSSAVGQPVRGAAKTGIQRYAAILEASYARLKSVSRRNIVIGGNTFTTGTVSPRRFIGALKTKDGRVPRMDLYGHNPFSVRDPDLRQKPMPRGYADFATLDDMAGWIDRHLGRAPNGRPLRFFLSELSLPTDHFNTEFNFFFSRRKQAQWLTEALRIVRTYRRIYTFGYLGLYDDPRVADNTQVERGLITRGGTRKLGFDAFRRGLR